MKKTTAFFLTIGVLAMMIGGIGSAFYYQRAQSTIVENSHEEYKIQNKSAAKETHINLSGNAHFVIQTEDSNQISMNTENGHFSNSDASLKVEEQSNKLMVNATANKQNLDIKGLQISFFDDFSSQVTITIPANIEKLIVNGNARGEVNLSGVNIDDVSLDMTNIYMSLDNINSERLTVSSRNGDIYLLNDVRTEETSIETTNGSISVNDFTANKLSATSQNGSITLDQTKGISSLETTNGDINLYDTKGEVTAKSTNGSFILQGIDLPNKLNVTVKQGDISLNTQKVLNDISITAKSKLGDITIFDENRTSYETGKAERVFKLESTFGDITVDGPYDYEEEE